MKNCLFPSGKEVKVKPLFLAKKNPSLSNPPIRLLAGLGENQTEYLGDVA
jgi:hypothetical protein